MAEVLKATWSASVAALSDVPLTSTKTNSTAAKSWSKIARTVMCTSRSRRVFVYSGGQPSSQLLIHRSSTGAGLPVPVPVGSSREGH